MTDMSQGKQPLVSLCATEAVFFSMSGTNASLGGTTLHRNCSGYEIRRTNQSQYSLSSPSLAVADDGCHLILGLGPTPTHFSGYNDSGRVNKTKESLTLSSFSEGSEVSEMLELGLSRGTRQSVVVEHHASPSSSECQLTSSDKHLQIPVVDESSTSAKKSSGGYMPALLFAPRLENSSNARDLSEMPDLLDYADANNGSFQHKLQLRLVAPTDLTAIIELNSSVLGRRTNRHHFKKCMFNGCSKGARGASGFCIGHGGGQRCQKPGCNKGAESRTAFCKAHGGGRRCQMLGCTKSAEGRTEHCIAHGGGHRCSYSGCTKAARGKSGLCIRHGGGKRCTVEGCTRSAEGQAGLCISHGGGRRCQYPDCPKGAQGSTKYCKAHGGGKRCIFKGCTKGAEGSTPLCKGHGGGKRCWFQGGGVCPKSVHGGTEFCVAHGGGKRCSFPGCSKSARGRTDCCVRHGGGKRCHFDGCDKSAQGSTNFCKGHGGGKRCTWGSGCDKFARGRSGLCAAHSTMMTSQQEHESRRRGNMIGPGLFRGVVSSSVTVGSSTDNEYSSSVLSIVSDCWESHANAVQQQLRIPSQVLVPNSMKSPSSSMVSIGAGRIGAVRSQSKSFNFEVPEGRVHGGILLSLLGGSLQDAMDAGLL